MKRVLVFLCMAILCFSACSAAAVEDMGQYGGNNPSGALMLDFQAWTGTEPGLMSMVFRFAPSSQTPISAVDPNLCRWGIEIDLGEYEYLFAASGTYDGRTRKNGDWEMWTRGLTHYGPSGATRLVIIGFDNSKSCSIAEGQIRGQLTIVRESGKLSRCTLEIKKRSIPGISREMSPGTPQGIQPLIVINPTLWKTLLQGEFNVTRSKPGLGLMHSSELGRLTKREKIRSALATKTPEHFKALLGR